MVSFKLLFTLCTATLVLAAPARRAVADIEADILSLTSNLATFANMVNAFPDTGGSPDDALAINQGLSFRRDLETVDDDTVATGPLDVADGISIICLLNSTVLDAWLGVLDALRAKEPALAATGIAPGEIFTTVVLISSTLRHTEDDLVTWFSDLNANLPATLLPVATSIEDTILGAVDSVVNQYQGGD